MATPGDANALLAEIEHIGWDFKLGGYSRPVFSPAELQLRDWFTSNAAARGLRVEHDANGIIWASWVPEGVSGKAIVTGSHLDSVPGGGNFDGPLGVASALAAVDLLRQRGVQPVRPLMLAVFPEEEGSRFGVACLGSRLMTGKLSPERARQLSDAQGESFAKVAARAGLDPMCIGIDEGRLAAIGAFLELHVEQGKGLIELGQPVALAGAILAHGRWHLRVTGRSDHAGSTRMSDRSDPVVVAAEAIQALRVRSLASPEARGTVGRLQVTPGGTNVIAGVAELWIDVRHRSEETVRQIVTDVVEQATRAAEAEGCTVEVSEQSFSDAVTFDEALRSRMHAVLPEAPVLDTAAGHDAGVLASAVPSGMLFVRNPSGASHTPAEHAEGADVTAGVHALALVLEELITSEV